MSLKTKNDYLIFASGTFLSEALPENFHEWDESELDAFILENTWQPFEDYSAEQVYGLIDTLAIHTELFFEGKMR